MEFGMEWVILSAKPFFFFINYYILQQSDEQKTLRAGFCLEAEERGQENLGSELRKKTFI